MKSGDATGKSRAPKTKKAPKTLTQEMSALLAKTFLPDLTERARQPAVEHALRQRWAAEQASRHTAATFEEWVPATVEQVGAAWILSCVFVRVLEDRGFLDRRRIAGEGADDSLQQFLEIAPALTERDYLLTVFRELATYPGASDVLDPAHNPAWRLSPSNDSVRALLKLLRETDAENLRFRFGRDDTRDTRFLGDLYQDLSESVRKRHALLQTPDFVERFILDQTLEPAIQEFGLESVRLIDPTCGSGHFLLGAFHCLFEHRLSRGPAIDRREHAKEALAQVYGVDINPYAVAIARFRLTLAYLEHAGIDRLALAPRIEINLVVADSLLHGAGQGRLSERAEDKSVWGDQMFALDDPEGARRVLGQRYHAVVGNPPYITCKDSAQREAYRQVYTSCYREFALGVPFTERFFQIAEPGGFVGLINSNSFTKREFGRTLIEKVLPALDLTEVIDASGAYIPGHGTPTVLLFGRNRPPVGDKVRAVMGKRGEPSVPADADRGLVWSSVAGHHFQVGFENIYVSVAEILRETLKRHPWSLGGGGAAGLKDLIERGSPRRLSDVVSEIGSGVVTREDDVYLIGDGPLRRAGIHIVHGRALVLGEDIRDWSLGTPTLAIWPYDPATLSVDDSDAAIQRFLWPFKTRLVGRVAFGMTQMERGLRWFEYSMFFSARFRTRFSIAFAFVSTHNHFVLDRGGKVFKQSAPIIKLPPTASEDDHLALLAYLNSSTACFWMKQVFYPKGSASGDVSKEKGKPEDNRYEFASTGLANMPLPPAQATFVDLARSMEELSKRRADLEPAQVLRRALESAGDLGQAIDVGERENERVLSRMVAVQEDIDWATYAAVGLAGAETARPWSADATLEKDDRPFARECAPPSLNAHDMGLWQARKAAIDSSPDLALIETAVNKRRWQGARGVFGSKVATYAERAIDAARVLLSEWAEEQVQREKVPVRMKELVARASGKVQPLATLTGADDVGSALAESIRPDSVPYLAPLVYSTEGLAKRFVWEQTWALQRIADRGEQAGTIPVPPKYDPDDYQQFSYWSLRGKLDVPKERFISYPGLERDDDKSPLIGWAGWSPLQRAQALAAIFRERKDEDGWPNERLVPIVAGLLALIPWIKQWHNDPDPFYDGQRMGDVYEEFVSEKARAIGVTLDDLRAWSPAAERGRLRTAKATAKAETKAATKAAAKAAKEFADDAADTNEEPVTS